MTTGQHVDDDREDETATRRRFLGATAAGATAAIAGCSGLLGGGSGDPAATVETFYGSLNEGDAESANALIHPEGNAEEITQQQAEQLSQADFSVDSTEVVEQGDGRAVVAVTITISMMGQEQSQTTNVELRTHEGQWKIWDSQSG